MKAPERERRDWIIVIVLLLIGFLCMIVAGGLATRFAPSWRLNANMESMLDPNSDFLTNQPVGFVEPLDPAILTQPAWINVFLTPGATFNTRTPVPTPTATNTIPPTYTKIPATKTPAPTNTFIYFPPTTAVVTRPPNTKVPPTNTSAPPSTSADLQITKDDGMTNYLAGSPITYTIVVTNNGPSNVAAATVTDAFDTTRLNNITWTCAYTNGASSACAGSGNINDSVSLPNGATVTYTVNAAVNATAMGNLVNTATVSAGINDPNTSNNTATDTDTFATSADLQITKTDNTTTYSAGSTFDYRIAVMNNGPNDVTGAVVTDNKPDLVSSWTWSCIENGGANGCSGVNNSNANFTNMVNLPNGSNIIYTVTVTIPSVPGGIAASTLTNTATVSVPAGITDPNLSNNSATDSDTPSTTTGINIGPPDGNSFNPGSNGSIMILFSPAIVADGDVGTPDFVYYEVVARNNPFPQVDLDWVKIEISQDGNTWYQVFYWGDGISDDNTNVALGTIGDVCFTNPGMVPTEIDNCSIPTTRLYPYPGAGITVDVDGLVPAGSYPWMRISGVGGADGPDIDAIQPYYP